MWIKKKNEKSFSNISNPDKINYLTHVIKSKKDLYILIYHTNLP